MAFVKTINEIARERLAECTESVSAQFLPAVRPIYGTKRGEPDQIGSCTLVAIRDIKYLVTAAHVIDEQEHSALYVAGASELVEIEGSFWTTQKVGDDRQNDHYDFAIWQMPHGFISRLGNVGYVPGTQLVANDRTITVRHNYVALGYPNSKNKRIDYVNKRVLPVAWKYSSMVKTDAALARTLGISGRDHLLLDFHRRHSKDAEGQLVNSVRVRGASGGALVDMGIIARPEDLRPGARSAGRLAGILIEQRPAQKKIVAVKIGFVFRAIGVQI